MNTTNEREVNKMLYRIDGVNLYTGIRFKEYYFGHKKTLKRIQYLLEERDFKGFPIYEITSIYPLAFKFRTLKKCLLGE